MRLIQAALRLRERALRRAFERTQPGPPLDRAQLAALFDEFPVRPNAYRRSAEDYRLRGEERRDEVTRLLTRPARVLEIGAGDGMACRAMQLAGFETVLSDIEVVDLDPRVRESGVDLVVTDAGRLAFDDESFDAVFSYNAFEHLPDPAAAFSEILRVLRPGGVGLVAFAALGYSPHGAHMYNEIGVPYVNVLFDPDTIAAFRRERGLDRFVPWINCWPIDRFREVFGGSPDRVETIAYEETRNLFHLDVVRRFLPQLRRAPSWDALVVDSVRFVFRKRR